MRATKTATTVYHATLHTLEIKPQLPEAIKPEAWHRMVIDKDHPCIDRMHRASDDSYSIIINPHKLHRTDDGSFIFSYRSLEAILQDMETICNDIGIEDYSLKRVDICLDTDAPFIQTHKLTHLIMLMLADRQSLTNRYESRDPLTLEVKSSTTSNGRRYDASLEIEHYNRALLDQSKWANAPVRNRFELRAMRVHAGKKRSIEGIAQDWQKRLAGQTEANLQHVTGNINDSLLAIWEDYAGRLKKPTSTHWNHFLANHADSIYTRDQLDQLCRRYDAALTPGKPSDDSSRINNLMMKSRFGSCFELFTFREIQAVAGRMQDALKRFAGGEFAGKKQPSEIIKFDDF